MAKILKYHIGNDEHLLLNGLSNTLSRTLITSATVTYTVVLSGGVSGITGQTWPGSMTVTNTDAANWAGQLINSLVVTDGEYYQARTFVDLADGRRAFFLIPLQGTNRDET